MGKPLLQQKRGKGSPAYRRPSHRFKAEFSHRPYDDIEKLSKMRGEVLEFVDDPARSTPLMRVLFENGECVFMLAPEGVKKGDTIETGAAANLSWGNVMPLSAIPDGLPVYALEVSPGDGGKLVRGAGNSAYIVSHEEGFVLVRLPSKFVKAFDARCRAQVGVLAGGGRLELPFMKAGKKYHAMHARNIRYPRVRGVAMNAVNHPFGGKEHHRGSSSCVSRNRPPGAKYGHLGARTVGRRTAAKDARKFEERHNK